MESFYPLMVYLSGQIDLASVSAWDSIRISTIHGGWMLLFIFFFILAFRVYWDNMIGSFVHRMKFTYLAITIPKMNEQTPRAVENFLAHLAGGHITQDLIEKYWLGEYQPWWCFEILSIEGHLQFVIYCPVAYRDLTESALYAQYPNAQITEVEEPAAYIPKTYPHPDYDAWGTEFTLVKPQEYPIQTYMDFVHSVTKEFFKDPMAALLETLSRIGVGEFAGFQIYISPTNKKWQDGGFKMASDLTMKLAQDRATIERPFPILHRGEMKLVEDVHRKSTKNGFKCKVRYVYVAEKKYFNKKHTQYGIVGAMKQFTRDDANGLKPLYSLTGVTGHYILKDWQKNLRKTAIVTAFRNRSGTRGGPKFILNTEELATLWHFPMAHAVSAPTLSTSDAKRAAAPDLVPLEERYLIEPPTVAPVVSPKKKFGRNESPAPHQGAPPPNLPFA